MEKLGNFVRKMSCVKNGKRKTVTVYRAMVLRNGWEIFQTEPEDSHDFAYGLTCGFEDEFGYFSLKEIEPFVVSAVSGKNLEEALPAQGWEWSGYDFAD
jgi:hypothetical protein